MFHEGVHAHYFSYLRLAAGAGLVALVSLAAPASAGDGAARLDQRFGQTGHVRVPGSTGARIAVGRSGRLIAASGGADSFLVTEYRLDGSANPRFGEQGTAEISLASLVRRPPPGEGAEASGGATPTAVRVQPDGKVLVAGTYNRGSGPNRGGVSILARLRPNGAIDTDFGGSRLQGGVPGQIIFEERRSIDAIALRRGKILIGGKSYAAFVGQLLPDGSLDPDFGRGRRGGWVRLPPPPDKPRYSVDAAVTGLSFGRGGTIYASGYANGNLMLARLRSDGRLDRRFAGHGLVKTNGSPDPGCRCTLGSSLTRDRSGRLLLVGSLESSNLVSLHRQVVIARYTPDGRLDRGFGRGGIVRTSVNSATYGSDIAVQRDGRIVVVGSSATAHRAANDGPTAFTVIRYLPNGRRDPTFFQDGVFKSRFGGIAADALDVLVDPAGRVVISGSVTHGVRFQDISLTAVAIRLLPGGRR